MKKSNVLILFFSVFMSFYSLTVLAAADHYETGGGTYRPHQISGINDGPYLSRIEMDCAPNYAWNQSANACVSMQASSDAGIYSPVSGQYYSNQSSSYGNCDAYGCYYNYDDYRNSCSYAQSYIPDGATIRALGGIDVYIIKYANDKKFKRLVLNPMVFENYGHLSWNRIIDVSPAILDCYTTSDLVRVDGRSDIFRLYPSGDFGTKRLIEPSAYMKYYIDPDSVYTINWFDYDSYACGIPLG
jgi:hypothetical protein